MNETVDKIPLSKVFVVNSVSATESLTPIVTAGRVRIMTGVTMSRVTRRGQVTCDPQHGSVRHVQLEHGQRLAALPLLQGLPVPVHHASVHLFQILYCCYNSIRGGQGSDQLIMPSESL